MKTRCMKLSKSVYSFLKQNIVSIIPKSFLFKNELFFRYIYGVLHIGKRHQCTICKHKLRSFVAYKTGDLICPFCGSLPRTRRLWQLLLEGNCLKGNVLHFSPSRSLYRKLIHNKNINYYSSDYGNDFLGEYKFDITEIDQSNDKFEYIICYHILEHIIDDTKAISELYRVLSYNGIIYLQTPFKEGDIFEDYTITSPQMKEIHFGQDDHVRIYSIEGLKKRLENAGFTVKVKSFVPSKKDLFYGFTSAETILILTK